MMLQTRLGWEKNTHNVKNKTVTTPKAKILCFTWSKLSVGEKNPRRALMTKGNNSNIHKTEAKEFRQGDPTEVSSLIYNCAATPSNGDQ